MSQIQEGMRWLRNASEVCVLKNVALARELTQISALLLLLLLLLLHNSLQLFSSWLRRRFYRISFSYETVFSMFKIMSPKISNVVHMDILWGQLIGRLCFADIGHCAPGCHLPVLALSFILLD